MATNVIARDVHMNSVEWFVEMQYLLHKRTKEAFLFAFKCVASRWHNLPFYEAVNYLIWHFIRNSQECQVTVAIQTDWN